jgi:hypothetical protein
MKDFNEVLPKFEQYLAKCKLSFSAVIIGGAAMQLLGLTERVTKDCDVLSPKITLELKEASKEFAKECGLSEDWLNNGPETLIRDLPSDWQKNVIPLYDGQCLKLFTLCRLDFIRSKLYAFMDRGIDLQDLIKLKPTKSEIDEVRDWLIERDGNPDWPKYIEIRLAELLKELYGDT